MDIPHYGDPLAEIGHIWGFWTLSGERVGVNVEGGNGGIFSTLCVEFCLVSFNVARGMLGFIRFYMWQIKESYVVLESSVAPFTNMV